MRPANSSLGSLIALRDERRRYRAMASMAKPSDATVTSPRRRSGFWPRLAASPRPCSQVSSASGSFDSTLSAALKRSGAALFAPASLSETLVAPGARNSSLWTCQDVASP